MRLAALALLAACGGGGAAVEPEAVIAAPRRPPEPTYGEGERELRRLKDATERYAKLNGAFPVGVAPAPSRSCCEAPDGTCAGDVAAWGGVWRELGFSIDAPHRFRYSYESADGTAFTATAASDLDCDGEESLYILQGTLTDGTLRYGLMRPPSDD